MNRFYKLLTIILALCLPWHGAITVFLPDFFRYWKEVILFLFFAGFCWEIYSKLGLRTFKDFLSPDLKNKSVTFAGLFLIYGLTLVLLSVDKVTALMAFRYLGLGVFVYLLFSLISQNSAKFQGKFEKYFSLTFIYSSTTSVLFGSWIKFGNGAEIARNFYSQTISSWVPGQTIPLWHEVGGFVRMQGASSGPIEFSHLLLVALFLTLISKIKNIYKVLFSVIFLFGIWQSASRAAAVGAIILLILHFIYPLKKEILEIFKKSKKIFLITILTIIFAGFWGINNTNILQRSGTLDHFTRPIESAQFGLDNIFSNNLGKLGPAARAKNLRENNNDKAMIAENVFIDVFAQMGVIGIILYLLFFYYLFKNIQPKFRGFFLAALIVMNLATIFDMTPVAISFFVLFFMERKGVKI